MSGRRSVSRQRDDLAAGGCIPDPYLTGWKRPDQPGAIGRVRDVVEPQGVRGEVHPLGVAAQADVPDAGRAVDTRGQDTVARRVEGDAGDGDVVAGENRGWLDKSVLRLPEPYRAVVGGRREHAVV